VPPGAAEGFLRKIKLQTHDEKKDFIKKVCRAFIHTYSRMPQDWIATLAELKAYDPSLLYA